MDLSVTTSNRSEGTADIAFVGGARLRPEDLACSCACDAVTNDLVQRSETGGALDAQAPAVGVIRGSADVFSIRGPTTGAIKEVDGTEL